MPKYGIHSIVIEDCINHLQTDSRYHANILTNNSSLAKLGAIGPDLFFWGPDYKIVDNFYELYINIKHYVDLYKELMEPIEKIKEEVEEKVIEPMEDTIEILFPSTYTEFRILFDELKRATEAYDTAKTTTIFAGVIEGVELTGNTVGLGSAINGFFKTFEPDLYYNRPEIDWYWFDMLHYRKSGEFANNLVKYADTDKKKAYAYGYLSHIATDMVGHSFVNQVVGAPYRSNVWRHVTVENYMDTWKFSRYYNGESINQYLREKLELPQVNEPFDDVPKLDSEITDLLHCAFDKTYSDVLHPIRIKDGFYSRKNIENTYEIFVRVMNLMEQSYLVPPEEPFEDVMDILADALNNVINSSQPPIPPSSSCTWNDVLSSSPHCRNLSEIIEEWIDYGVQLLEWQSKLMFAIIDMLIATFLSLPVAVVLSILYGFQLICYSIYRTVRMILSLNGLVYPEPDELEWPIGQRLTMLVQECGVKDYPSTGIPSRNNHACPVNTIERESIKAGLYSGRLSNPDSFIGDSNGTINIDNLKAYVDADNPEETKMKQDAGLAIGNAIPLTLWMIKNAEIPTLQKYVFTNWNLDSDRGYGYKTWHGFLNKTLHRGEVPEVFPITYFEHLPANYSIGDNCFDLFSATVAPSNQPNLVNAYLLSIASQFDYPDQLYVDPLTDRNLYEKRFRYLMNRWGLEIKPNGFIKKRTSTVDTEVVVMKNSEISNPFIIVLFRGSETPMDPPSAIRDWVLSDFNARPINATNEPNFTNVRFHKGFWDAFEIVKDDIEQRIRDIKTSNPSVNYRVWLTGNSLGAALANICGLWLAVHCCPVEGVYTFAAPKCADEKFAALYNEKLLKRCHRWVNGHKLPSDDRRDIVTEAPPFPPYKHVGKEHEVDETEDYLLGGSLIPTKIRAHFTEGYSRGIYKQLIKKYPNIVLEVPLPSA